MEASFCLAVRAFFSFTALPRVKSQMESLKPSMLQTCLQFLKGDPCFTTAADLAQYSARSSTRACFGHSPYWSSHLATVPRYFKAAKHPARWFSTKNSSKITTLAVLCALNDLLLEISSPSFHLRELVR